MFYLKKAFGTLLFIIALFYIYQAIRDNISEIRTFAPHYTNVLIISLFIASFAGLCNVFIWQRTLFTQGVQSHFINSYYAWAKSRVYRYIPGKIFSYTERIKLQNSKRKKSVTIALLSETSANLICSLYLLIALSFISHHEAISFLSTAALVALSYFFYPYLVKIAMRVLNFIDKKNDDEINIKRTELLKLSFLVFPIFIFHGLAQYILLIALFGQASISFITLTVAFYASGLVGMLTPFPPSGIGVKEGVLILLLTSLGLPTTEAVIYSLFSRVLLIASELVNLALSFLLTKYWK